MRTNEGRDRIHEALQEILNESMRNPGLLLNWVLVAEVHSQDGDPTLLTRVSEDMLVWRELGMLETISATLRDDLVRAFQDEEED